MAVAILLAVAVGGAVGSVFRYLTERWATTRFGSELPWGTFIANMIGSAILGAVLGSALASDLPHWAIMLLGTGVCGALTTFSGFALQILVLAGAVPGSTMETSSTRRWRAAGYAALSLGLGLLVALVTAHLLVALIGAAT